MFSGIVETTAGILTFQPGVNLVQINIAKPPTFDDIKIGDSIAVDGICLTVETFDAHKMQFSLGPETLKVTGWTASSVVSKAVNLERSLRLNDRIHGHLVTGHVDAVGKVVKTLREGDTQLIVIRYPEELKPYVWKKGSITVNGVSLTINSADENTFAVGLIPETLKRTNLGLVKEGQTLNLEVDNMARGLVRWASLQREKLK